MIRSSKHILKYQTGYKTEHLDSLFQIYLLELQRFVDLLWDGVMPIQKFMSSRELDGVCMHHSNWLNSIYKHASEICRSVLAKKLVKGQAEHTKPVVKNLSITLNYKLFDIADGDSFDEFIRIKMPYFREGVKRAVTICVPIKQHKHSLKYAGWKRAKSIRLSKRNGNYYMTFFYESPKPPFKKKGNSLGVDVGYKKMIATSDGKMYGTQLNKLYSDIARKKRGSKNYKQSLIHRDNLINEECNKIDLSNVKELIVEDLKYVKYKSKFSKALNNKMQYWSYLKVLSKLERLCATNGVRFTKVDPRFTSQTCNKCGVVDKSHRVGEIYSCTCGNVVDADTNASINILHRGVYNPSAINDQRTCV